MVIRKSLKLNYFGFLGLLGFMGFEDPWYFLFFLFFLFFLAPGARKKDVPELMQKQAKEKQDHLQKILELAYNQEKIANNDVEKLLGVSNATAERYLDELEHKGLLKQVGKIGQNVYYQKVRE